jgi:stage V sporulation protein S
MIPMQNIDLSPQLLKVSAQSNPKASAGSISHRVRRGQNPQIMCSGSPSINQAIKAIAIARGYIEQDGFDVSVSGTWRDREMQKITLNVNKTARPKRQDESKQEPDVSGDLRIAQNSVPGTVAGAIAKKVRSGEKVSMVAIGASSVANAVMSIIIARRYLQDDGVDISFRPEFVHLQMNDEQRSAVRFNVLRHDV